MITQNLETFCSIKDWIHFKWYSVVIHIVFRPFLKMKKYALTLFVILLSFYLSSAQNCDDDYDVFSGFLDFFGLFSSDEDCFENVTSKFMNSFNHCS